MTKYDHSGEDAHSATVRQSLRSDAAFENRPSLSVVVANYNHARHLPKCLNALLSQSVPAQEILIIDDGSTDNSMDVINEFAARHPVIKVYRNDRNRGIIYTQNRGIELARGDYLYLPAADDEVMPGLFEKSLGLLAQHPQAALSCSISKWRDESSGLTWHMGAGMANRPSYLSPDELMGCERAGRLAIVSHSSIMKMSVVREFGGLLPGLRWHCDWFLTYAAAFRYGLCFVPETLSLVYLHGNSYYGTGQRSGEHALVMEYLLDLLHEERYRDVGARIRKCGALALHSTPMLFAMLRNPRKRDFITPLFVWKCMVRRAQLFARRHFPNWLARACIRVFISRPPLGQAKNAQS